MDGNFDEEWGDCQYLQVLMHHVERGMHRVEVEILPCEQKDALPFYLMGMIVG